MQRFLYKKKNQIKLFFFFIALTKQFSMRVGIVFHEKRNWGAIKFLHRTNSTKSAMVEVGRAGSTHQPDPLLSLAYCSHM